MSTGAGTPAASVTGLPILPPEPQQVAVIKRKKLHLPHCGGPEGLFWNPAYGRADTSGLVSALTVKVAFGGTVVCAIGTTVADSGDR
jgi:hypothetical protein